MVASVIDPRIISVLNLTIEERAEIQREIDAGNLPPNYWKMRDRKVAQNVFGEDHAVDSRGRPIEQGIGSKGRETINHFAALKRSEALGQELPGTYAKIVAELHKRDPERARQLHLPGSK